MSKAIKCEAKSKAAVERWQNPEYRAKLLPVLQERMRRLGAENAKLLNAPLALQKRKVSQGTQEAKRRYSEASKRKWENPEYRAKCVRYLHSAEYRAEKSRSMKAYWANPEWRAQRMAAIKPGRHKLCANCAMHHCLACDGEGCRCSCAVLDRPMQRVHPVAHRKVNHGR